MKHLKGIFYVFEFLCEFVYIVLFALERNTALSTPLTLKKLEPAVIGVNKCGVRIWIGFNLLRI
jgi:hypothetical protein